MPETKDLAGLRFVTDDDTGMYTIGELDGGWQEQNLDYFLEQQGQEGYDKLMLYITRMQSKATVKMEAIKRTKESATGTVQLHDTSTEL